MHKFKIDPLIMESHVLIIKKKKEKIQGHFTLAKCFHMWNATCHEVHIVALSQSLSPCEGNRIRCSLA